VEVEYPEPQADERDEGAGLTPWHIDAYAIKELLPAHRALQRKKLKTNLNRFSPISLPPLSDLPPTLTRQRKGSELQDVLNTIPVLRRMEKVRSC